MLSCHAIETLKIKRSQAAEPHGHDGCFPLARPKKIGKKSDFQHALNSQRHSKSKMPRQERSDAFVPALVTEFGQFLVKLTVWRNSRV